MGEAARTSFLDQMGIKPSPEPVMPPIPEVSGGTIDRIKIAAERHAEGLKSVPGGEAGKRTTSVLRYRDGQRRLTNISTTFRISRKHVQATRNIATVSKRPNRAHAYSRINPRDFAAYLEELPEKAKGDLRVAVREQVHRQGGRPIQGCGIASDRPARVKGAGEPDRAAGRKGSECAGQGSRVPAQRPEARLFRCRRRFANRDEPGGQPRRSPRSPGNLTNPMGAAKQAIIDLLKSGSHTMTRKKRKHWSTSRKAIRTHCLMRSRSNPMACLVSRSRRRSQGTLPDAWLHNLKYSRAAGSTTPPTRLASL